MECLVPEDDLCEADDPNPESKDCEISAKVTQECLASTLQPGNSLVCSGYCLYSSSTFFALTLGAGVQAAPNPQDVARSRMTSSTHYSSTTNRTIPISNRGRSSRS